MAGKPRPAKRNTSKTGRPTSYTEDLGALLCERLIHSDYGLEQICQADELPHPSTVYRWLAAHESFREQYARAKELQGHVQADRGLKDALEAKDAALGRLRWDARRWHASKLAPRQYGDKVQAEVSGPGGGPVQIERIERVIVDPRAPD